MRRDVLISLVTTTKKRNDLGDIIETSHLRPVYAEEKSIRQTEHYQAAATGLKPEITFKIWWREYAGEIRVQVDGRKYDVIRTFKPNPEEVELVCGGVVNRP